MALRIRQIECDADREACYDVRCKVFVDEQGVPLDEELDDFDPIAEHFVVELDETIIATARLVDTGAETGKIGRVAVLKEYRGRGLGRDLLCYIMEAGFQRFPTLILDAQLSVIPFYERLGFAAEGHVFLDAGIEHRRMRIRATPDY